MVRFEGRAPKSLELVIADWVGVDTADWVDSVNCVVVHCVGVDWVEAVCVGAKWLSFVDIECVVVFVDWIDSIDPAHVSSDVAAVRFVTPVDSCSSDGIDFFVFCISLPTLGSRVWWHSPFCWVPLVPFCFEAISRATTAANSISFFRVVLSVHLRQISFNLSSQPHISQQRWYALSKAFRLSATQIASSKTSKMDPLTMVR